MSKSLTESDENAPMNTARNTGGTLWDETIRALTRALDRATDDATISRIVTELRALREGK